MHNDNTAASIGVPLLFKPFLSLSLSVWFFSLQGLAHLKAEQGTLFLVSLHIYIYMYIVFPLTAWLGFGAFTLCASTTCPCSFVCCSALSLLLQRTGLGLFVCSCVCVCVLCRGQMHGGSAFYSSHLRLSFSSSISPLAMILCLLTIVSPRLLWIT